MIKINNVSVNINPESGYSHKEAAAGEKPWQLSVNVSSDSREFLERVAQAVHRELANPQSVVSCGQALDELTRKP